MSEYIELQKQIAALQEKAAQVRDGERRTALEQINTLVESFDIRASEVQFARGARSSAGTQKSNSAAVSGGRRHPTAGITLPAKYRDDVGNEWSGRGMQPRWLREAVAAGKALESFAVAGS